MNLWCLILGHVISRELLDKEVGNNGWPCLENCLRCGNEWVAEIPLELLEGDVAEKDPDRLGPWEVWFCMECGRGPMPLKEGEEDEGDRLCGICDV